MILVRAVKAAAVGGVVAGATLVAAAPASATIVSTPISPFVIWYPGTGGTTAESNFPGGNFISGSSQAIAPGTSLSGAVTATSFQYTWQGADHDLFTTGPHGPIDTGAAMASGTSPSLAIFTDGSWMAAIHGADGGLHSVVAAGDGNWGFPMAPGTNPSIAATRR